MKEKYICKTIPEGCNRESQYYKSKEAETPDKNTRGWSMCGIRGWLTVAIPESCGRRFSGWFMVHTQGDVVNSQAWNNAFTLIELLVVVLIIGILAAIAVPQYQKAVERAKWTEAIVNIRAIAHAHMIYYLANNAYLTAADMDKLDVQFNGTVNHDISPNRLLVKDFIYSPNGAGSQTNFLALAQWTKQGVWERHAQCYLYIDRDDIQRIHCYSNKPQNDIQKQICRQIEEKGTL